MNILAIILKIAAIIAGAALVFWGYFIGILGLGPDGPVPGLVRAAGITAFVAGAVSWIPNGLLIRYRVLMLVFLLACAAPFAMLIALAAGDFSRHGLSPAFGLASLARFAAVLFVLGLAPSSLIIKWKTRSSNKAPTT